MSPLVSVCIPCYNAERYVAAALDSVIRQTYKPIEIVVVNDRSTDGSLAVLRSYENHGVVVIDEKCGNASKARNRALRDAHGEYIKFFDADDLLHPRMIESQISRLEGMQSDVASSGWGRFYNDHLTSFKLSNQSVWRDMDARDWLVEAWMDARPMMQPGMFLIPRKLVAQSGGWDEGLTLIDDFEFFSNILSLAENVCFTPDVDLKYRSGLNGSLSTQKSDEAIESAFRSLIQGTGHLLKVRDDSQSRLACANLLQDFIHSYFPRRRDLLKEMAIRVAELGGSNLTPSGPPRFHLLRRVVGWKLARRIQHQFST